MKINGYTCEIVQHRDGFKASFPQLPGLYAYADTRRDCHLMAQEALSEFLSESTEFLDSLNASADQQSRQNQILATVVSILGGPAESAFRCRFSPFSADELPADNVVPDDEAASYEDTNSIDLRCTFRIRHTAAAVDAVDDVVDARFVRAQKLLLADPTLGGIVRYCRYLGRKWEYQQGTLDTAASVATYEVEFSTTRTDPTQAGL